MTTETQDTAALFRSRAEDFGHILDAVDDRWDAPSPCEGWTARDVVAHVVETERDFLQRHDLGVGPAPDLADPAAAWRAHASEVAALLATDGLAEREYDGYFGRTTFGDTLADFYGWDIVIHSWDVARATGQDWHVDDDEAAAMSRVADGWGDALHSEGVCGPPVPVADDAGPQDRLLARLGRNPRWTAPGQG